MNMQQSHVPNWCKSYLKQSDIASLESLIKEIEISTTGELVVVINRRCTEYKLLPLTLSLLFWIGIENSTLIDYVVGQFGHFTLWKLGFVFVSILLGYALGQMPFWYRWLSSEQTRSTRAWAAAELEFFRSKIQATKEATGILVFISLYEHQVVVLADKQISDKKPQSAWSDLVSSILSGIRTDNLASGLSEGLKQSGIVLKELFPAKQKNDNELSNSIVFRDPFEAD